MPVSVSTGSPPMLPLRSTSCTAGVPLVTMTSRASSPVLVGGRYWSTTTEEPPLGMVVPVGSTIIVNGLSEGAMAALVIERSASPVLVSVM